MQLARIDMAFHADCWATLHDEVQTGYQERAREEGVAALVGPYRRSGAVSWLPEAGIDDVVEDLQAQVEQHLNTEAGEDAAELAAMPDFHGHHEQIDDTGDIGEIADLHQLPEPRPNHEPGQASAAG